MRTVWPPLIVIFAFFLLVTSTVSSQTTGSGTISGVFSNSAQTTSTGIDNEAFVLVDELPAGADVLEAFRNSVLPTTSAQLANLPISNGAGTSTYRWGLEALPANNPSRLVVNGEELADIFEFFGDDASFVDGAFTGGVISRIFDLSGNSLSFSSGGFENQQRGETFVAGHLEYSNEENLGGTSVPSVSLTLSSLSENPEFNQSLEIPISIVTVPNDGDIEANADFIFFTNRPELGSFRVLEGETTSVEVLAEFNSLDLIGFGEIADSSVGFLSFSVSVPEPSTLAFIALSIGMGLSRRRRH